MLGNTYLFCLHFYFNPSVIITVYDKIVAIKAVRIPERTLMTFAALGGAAAMYVTMKAIRHKTLHKIYDRFTGIYYFTYMIYISAFLITKRRFWCKTIDAT